MNLVNPVTFEIGYNFSVPTVGLESLKFLEKTYGSTGKSEKIEIQVPFEGLERLIIWEMISSILKNSNVSDSITTLEFALYYVRVENDKYLVCHDYIGRPSNVSLPASYYFGKIELDKLLGAFSTLHGGDFGEETNWPYWSGMLKQALQLKKSKDSANKDTYHFSGTQTLYRLITGEYSSFAPLPPFFPKGEPFNPRWSHEIEGIVVSSWKGVTSTSPKPVRASEVARFV
ncbi:MAG: hypothetical protein ACK52P_06835 [Alphaproteobacteria bacterium]|jgi:hypothetical protein